MNRKFIIGLMLAMFALPAMAHDLIWINANGDTLYLNNVSDSKHGNAVEVTYKGSWWGAVENEYHDTVDIPCVVTIDKRDYTVIGIDEHAFSECRNLIAITIPESIEYIRDGAFYHCCHLHTINYNAIRCADFTLPSFAPFSFGNMAVGEYVYDESNRPESFWSAYDLEELNIGEKVERIPDYMFYGLGGGLQQADLTTSPYTIEDSKEGVEHINFIGSPKEFGNQAFRGCRKLQEITLPAGTTFIGQALFANCDTLSSVTIPEGIEELPAYFFMSCKNLSDINLPSSLKKVSFESFKGCTKLVSVKLPEGLTVVGPSAFRSCTNLVDIVLPNSLETIDGYAFSDCTLLQSIIIPAGVNEIGNYAFEDCTNLREVTLQGGEATKMIGNFVFAGCMRLSDGVVNVPAKMPKIKEDTFFGVKNTMKVNCPVESENDYRNDAYWGRFFMPTGIESVGGTKGAANRKYMLDGKLLIENEGAIYTTSGQQIK